MIFPDKINLILKDGNIFLSEYIESVDHYHNGLQTISAQPILSIQSELDANKIKDIISNHIKNKLKMGNYMKDLCKVLETDKGMRNAWQANIAMAFYDESNNYKKKNNKKNLSKEDIHMIANVAADNFLNLLCK